MVKIVFLMFALVFFSACDRHKYHDLRIAVSPWIGYSPIYYAQEQGWLKDANIKLIHTTSLYDTVHYFQADLVDAFMSTQYEVSLIKDKKIFHLLPLDRSNGGDVVLSNISLDKLVKSENITAYLEVDSINKIIFNEFIKKHSIPITKIEITNKSQSLIKGMTPNNNDDAVIIITYEPYATFLKKSGFIEVDSTRNSEILVLDSLYVNDDFFNNHQDSPSKIKDIINRSYAELEKDPKAYYEVIKPYLENLTYDEFADSLSNIEWLLGKSKPELDKVFISHDILPLRTEK